jgi:hypothetical protein
MAQHDYNIANLAGAAFRADLNDALSAIATNNSGTTAPSTTFAYQWHVDTDAPATLYIRNGANSAYIEVGDVTLDNLGLKKTRRATAQASTSGTAITFGSIPSWANQITMMLNGVSGSGTSELLVQLGTASGFTTSGYNSNADSCTATASENSTAGFLLENTNNASYLHSGLVEMMRIDGNAWVYTSALKRSYSGGTTVINSYGAGDGTLASVLTQVRLTTVGGTDTFDAGTVNIVYES